MKKIVRLTENDIHRIVKKTVNSILKEGYDTNKNGQADFYDFVDILDKNGWAYDNYQDVVSKDGRKGTRYTLSTNGKHNDFEMLKNDILNAFPNAVFGTAQHRHAPEINHQTVIITESKNDILKMVRSMRSNILDLTEDGYGILYVDYDPQTNELFAGYATNIGIPKNYSIQYDEDFSLDQNLEALVEEIYSHPAPDDEIHESKIKRIVNETFNKYLKRR